MTTQTERPANALQFRGEKNQFSIDKTPDGKYTISLVAFSGKTFFHWWWGRCVFERAGATIAHPKIPIDWNHDSDIGMGFLDTFGGNPSLDCSGYLLPNAKNPQDITTDVIDKKEQGMPYQCSVNIGNEDLVTEFVSEGTLAEVNGETVIGPITIFRKFRVGGVAICLYGSDTNTTVFNNQKQGTDSMPKNMTADQKSARDEAKLFAKKFGNDRGFKYFSEGLSEDEAKDAYIEETSTEVEAKDARIAELEAKVAELEAAIVEKDARIAELEAQLNAATQADATESTPVSAEEFKKLQTQVQQFSQAAGKAGGEAQPLSGGEPNDPKPRQFSALKPGMRAFAGKAAEAVARAQQTQGK